MSQILLTEEQRQSIASGARRINLTPQQHTILGQLQDRAEADTQMLPEEELLVLRRRVSLLEDAMEAVQSEMAHLRGA